MAITQVPVTYTFDLWRQKTNELGTKMGDLALLNTPVTTSLVDAINVVQDQIRAGGTQVAAIERRILMKALALN